MPLLLLASIIWAFSFGLIKGRLAGLDSAFIAAVRLGLALVVFLPFLRPRGVSTGTALTLTAIGGVQFGLMYLAYNESFRYLAAYEVALFTITTPLFVVLLADALELTVRPRALVAALLSIGGASLIIVRSAGIELTLTGVALVQLSNLAFAAGQVWYKRLRARQPALRDREVFGFVYGGAALVAAAALGLRDAALPATVTASHAWTLVYLGVLASGVGFFLWNVGATRVGAGTLAVMNNAKVPLAVACSVVFFGEKASLPRLAGSLLIMGLAVWLAERSTPDRRS
jgi:drug/metabolite transporter (DMT)-like permease